MTKEIEKLFKFHSPFLNKKRVNQIVVHAMKDEKFPAWLKQQDKNIQSQCRQQSYAAHPCKALPIRNKSGEVEMILIGINTPCGIYDIGGAIAAIRQALAGESLDKTSFYISGQSLSRAELENLHIGWGLACYTFDSFKSRSLEPPALLWSKGIDQARVLAMTENVHFLRNIINAPANAMGPDELEKAARHIAKKGKATITVIDDDELLRKDFPLVHAVGDGSDRRPRLIDIRWGNGKDPKVTLVGKGVCFDTGGLNIKPTPAMALMKKDMGGAAHVLALAGLVMALKLPVRLRVLIPAVENSISGRAFRPGDIFRSRKGLTVENTNTDAEGRLILADALTYACEDKPELLIDYATLTGSARAALGPDIPPVFSSNEKVASELKKFSIEAEDPVWPMPLWQPYKKIMESSVADLVNSASIPGDLIYSALFLQQFLTGNPDWVHLDVYAWEQTGRPGRPKGGADTGLRTVLRYMEERYARKRKSRKA